MKRRVLRWYDYSWSRGRIQGGGDINTALGLLPDKLKTELALHVNLSVLKKVTIFQECQPEFLHDLVLKMKAYIFTPGDSICRKGEVAREMFIIADGILEVLSETGKVLTTMKAGDFFGEIGILNLDGLNKWVQVAKWLFRVPSYFPCVHTDVLRTCDLLATQSYFRCHARMCWQPWRTIQMHRRSCRRSDASDWWRCGVWTRNMLRRRAIKRTQPMQLHIPSILIHIHTHMDNTIIRCIRATAARTVPPRRLWTNWSTMSKAFAMCSRRPGKFSCGCTDTECV